jgi:hypothetical protein
LKINVACCARDCENPKMLRLSSRYVRVKGFGRSPTPKIRAVAAAFASVIAFGTAYLLFGMIWGAGSAAIWLCGISAGVAAGYAAATTRWGLGATFGVLAALWVLLEASALLIGAIAASLG